jgi:hypothetical protein
MIHIFAKSSSTYFTLSSMKTSSSAFFCWTGHRKLLTFLVVIVLTFPTDISLGIVTRSKKTSSMLQSDMTFHCHSSEFHRQFHLSYSLKPTLLQYDATDNGVSKELEQEYKDDDTWKEVLPKRQSIH